MPDFKQFVYFVLMFGSVLSHIINQIGKNILNSIQTSIVRSIGGCWRILLASLLCLVHIIASNGVYDVEDSKFMCSRRFLEMHIKLLD